MQTFIKCLADNELGRTGGHQRGGVLVPKDCIKYFPALGPSPNPEAWVKIKFEKHSSPVDLRIIHYDQGTRNEYRLTPIPYSFLRGARAGDFLLLTEQADGTYVARIAAQGSPLFGEVSADAYGRRGWITPKDYRDPLPPPPKLTELTTALPPNAPPPALPPTPPPPPSLAPAAAGAGFGDTAENAVIEKAAIACVTQNLAEDGWRIRSVESEKVGYDLECTMGLETKHVEVKGTKGTEPAFVITFGEVDRAKTDPLFELQVVTSALTPSPVVHQWSGREFLARFDLRPVQFVARMRR